MDYTLLLAVFLGVATLLFLILYLKIQAFLALLITSLIVGLIAGMPPQDILESIKNGMGSTLGFVATVVGLGALFGAILEKSGGAEMIANYLLGKFGEKRAPWSLLLTGFLVAIPVFFDVGIIILIPIVYALQKQSGKSLLYFGLPLLTGLAVTHTFIPPTPGPVAVADILKADLGWVIIIGAAIGLPTAIISGPFLAKFLSKRIFIPAPTGLENSETTNQKPPVGLIFFLIAIPILLIVLNTISSNLGLPPKVQSTLQLVGHPFTALIIANLLSWYLLGIKRGLSKEDLLKISSKSLAPAGVVILLTGAGGAFKQLLIDTGTGQMIATSMAELGLSPVIFGFLVAAAVRVLQGSATVAMITGAGICASVLPESLSDPQKALVVVAIASGATILSHVNDSGFWLINRYFGMTEKQTIQTWTVNSSVIAISGLIFCLIAGLFF